MGGAEDAEIAEAHMKQMHEHYKVESCSRKHRGVQLQVFLEVERWEVLGLGLGKFQTIVETSGTTVDCWLLFIIVYSCPLTIKENNEMGSFNM